jgi:hypothetical protein
MWGFTPSVFAQFDCGFKVFLEANRDNPRAELPLPTLIETLVRDGQARVRVLHGAGPWCGVTYPDDREPVARFLSDLVAGGHYPLPAWR